MATKVEASGSVAKLDQPKHAKGESLWLDAWRRLRRNRAALMGFIIIIANILLATFAPLVAPSDFRTQVLEEANVAPNWIINLFPVMKPRDQSVNLTPPTAWEVQVENGDTVNVGDVLATREELGTTREAIIAGTVYTRGSTVNVTRANIEFYDIDENWEVLLDQVALMNAINPGTIVARTTDGEEVIQTQYRSLITMADDTIIIKEQDGGYVQVSNDYPLGSDYLGRDLLSRIIYGARVSLSVAFIGPLVSLFFGINFGLLAGYLGGRVDNLLMRFVDIMYAFPTILLIILLMAFFRSSFVETQPGTLAYTLGEIDRAFGGMLFIFIGIGITSWMGLARLTRGQVLSVREMEYIEAARSIGTSQVDIIRQHVLPNILGPIIVAETLTIPTYISYEAFLSFIGLGVNPPTPSWGAMIADGAESIATYPNQAIFPALALFFVMFAFNFLGDGLRDALDPRMRGVE